LPGFKSFKKVRVTFSRVLTLTIDVIIKISNTDHMKSLCIKTAGLLFCCILTCLFFSCEGEELQQENLSIHFKEEAALSKRELVAVKDIASLEGFLSEKIAGKRRTKNARDIIETPYGIVVLEGVLKVMDAEGNINYTFTVLPETPRLDTFFNLIVYQSPDADVAPVAYFLQYKMSDAFFDAFYSGRKTIDQFAGRVYKHSFDDFTSDTSFHAKLSDPCPKDDDSGVDSPINSCPVEDPDSDGSTGDPNDYVEIDLGDTSDSSGGGGTTSGPGGPGNTEDTDVGDGLQCSTITVYGCCAEGYCYSHAPINGCGGAGAASITTCVDTNNKLMNEKDKLSKLISGGCDQGDGDVGINYLNLLTGSIFTGGMGSERMAWLNENCPERQLMFFIWNNSPMTSAELPLHRAMVDFMRSSDSIFDTAVVGEANNAVNVNSLSYDDAISFLHLLGSNADDNVAAKAALATLKVYNEGTLNGVYDTAYYQSINPFFVSDTTDPYFNVWFTIRCATLKALHPEWSDMRVFLEASMEGVHLALDAIGLIPLAGEPADLINGSIYLVRGDNVNASLSYAATVPIAGWIATGSKSVIKIISLEGGEKAIKIIAESAEKVAEYAAKLTPFFNQIDDAITALSNGASYVLEGTGAFKQVGGHHPLAKKAFEGHDAYSYRDAFSVSENKLNEITGFDNTHNLITGKQNSLYTAWKAVNPNRAMTINEMANIEIQAMVLSGIPEDVATGWVIKALEDLKQQGVSAIENIPWNGVNPN